MIFKFTVAAATATILTLPAAGFAQQLGTAQEARTMLDKAVAAATADRDLALAMFNKGKDGFRDRDLYAFCARIADAKALATPLAVAAGTDVSTLKDPTGKAYGLELYATAQKPEGEVTEVSYMFPKPGTTTPAVAKVSFVTKAGDLICGVGYYK